MRAIFLCPNVPYPPQNGGHHRNLGLIRSLSRFAEVHVLAVGDPGEARTEQAREALSAWGSTLEAHPPTGPGRPEEDEKDTARPPDAFAHFRAPGLAAALARRLETARYDFAHVEEVVMTQYLPLLPRPRVLDRQKVDWAYHEAMAAIVHRGTEIHVREAARFRGWENSLLGAFERMLVPGLGDQQLLEPFHGRGALRVVPIGIDDALGAPAAPGRVVDHVLLYGALDYGPNVEAQRWFFDEVWPALRRAEPALRAVVVGSGRPPLRSAPPPSDSGVEVRGFVPDIQAVLQDSGVLVVAVRVGGGARTKILEALACGMPVVSTAIGVENLGLVPGRDFLLAETAPDMVAAILRLASDPGLVASLGREGAARADAFRWSRIDTEIEAIYRDVVASPREADTPRAASAAAFASGAGWTAGAPGGARRARALVNRLVDRLLAPGGGTGLAARARRGLADLLRRISS